MAEKTISQIVHEIVDYFPNLDLPEIQKATKQLGYKETVEDLASLVAEAKLAQNQAVVRFRDLVPDDNVFELNIEKGGKVKFGIITDTHFGSKFHKRKELEQTVSIMLNEGVSTILCSGDLVEGYNVYKGQTAHLTCSTADDQITEAIKGLPVLPKGKKYNWISGNHDLIWLRQSTGSDPLISVTNARSDINYLGKYSAYVWVSPNICVQLVHPDKGGGVSLGYPAQRYIDRLPNDRRPDIAVFGHWHNPASFMYKDVHIELNASFQGPNDLSIRNGWPSVVGGKIVELTLNKDGKIQRYKPESIEFYQKSLINSNRIKL